MEIKSGEMLAKSGSSVTVTSITDVLCFAVGLFSNLPVVRLFCLYTSLALAVDYIYQVKLLLSFHFLSFHFLILFLNHSTDKFISSIVLFHR